MPETEGDAANPPLFAWLFGEDQARYSVATADVESLLSAAEAADVPARVIGQTGGQALILPDGTTLSLEVLERAHEEWLPRYMDGSP